MPQFSRKTLLAATDLFDRLMGHAQIDRFLLEYGLENIAPADGSSKQARAAKVARFILVHPERTDEEGTPLVDAVVNGIVGLVAANRNPSQLHEDFPALINALARDGFSLESGRLTRTLPAVLDLPAADDEVHSLLNAFGFATATGHLDQGVEAHTNGNWASANSQFRAFIESLLDEVASSLNPGGPLPATSHQRRTMLAQLNPPFFDPGLNEWTGDGKGFIEAFFRRLHPQGSHPGLSDEQDSTFRLHLVLLVARLLLRRLRRRTP